MPRPAALTWRRRQFKPVLLVLVAIGVLATLLR